MTHDATWPRLRWTYDVGVQASMTGDAGKSVISERLIRTETKSIGIPQNFSPEGLHTVCTVMPERGGDREERAKYRELGVEQVRPKRASNVVLPNVCREVNDVGNSDVIVVPGDCDDVIPECPSLSATSAEAPRIFMIARNRGSHVPVPLQWSRRGLLASASYPHDSGSIPQTTANPDRVNT